MKQIKAKFTPFTAISIMLMVVVVFGAISLILVTTLSIDIKNVIDQVNLTTRNTNFVAEQIAEVFFSQNRTNTIIDEIGIVQQAIRDERRNQTESLLPIFLESFSQTEHTNDLVVNLTNSVQELTELIRTQGS